MKNPHVLSGTEGMESRKVIYLEPEKFPLPASVPSLPRTTYDQFATARSQHVKEGYIRSVAEIHDSIGPWQREEGSIWFGKNFYDSEGSAGVGGFGYFDEKKKSCSCSIRPRSPTGPWRSLK